MSGNTQEMIFHVRGVGAWGPGFNDWNELRGLLHGTGQGAVEQLPGPKPTVIPANERRRAPLMVRLAVEASQQAVDAAQMQPEQLGCVFGSGHGDTDITDYMCRTLNTEAKQLSPTKFHNSVHNAAAGYWTISTECMRSANSIAGFTHTASLSLLEAASQCLFEGEPMLLTLFDAPVCKVLQPILDNSDPFAAAIILAAGESEVHPTLRVVQERIADASKNQWSALPSSVDASVSRVYEHNPSARILGLLSLITGNHVTDQPVHLRLGEHARLSVQRIS